MDVPEGEACPVCGKTPPASSMRVAWMYARQRALDWMSWNAVMRIAVPVLAAATALGLVLELLLGGGAGVRQLLNSGFLWVMGMLLLFVAAVTLLVFALGGADELYCAVDSRGFHVRTALPGANRVKLWMHGKSAALMDTADTNGRVILSEKDLAWKDIARVQLWTDKRLMLLYSPRWWMKLSVPILLAKWKCITYGAILGLVVASPFAILMGLSLPGFNLVQMIVSVLTFILGFAAAWLLARKDEKPAA